MRFFRFRARYWNTSKLADIILGESRPHALTMEDWAAWREDVKKRKPVRYYISDKVLKTLQNICYYPYDVYSFCRIYIKNAYINKTHLLNTKLKKGDYYEYEDRLLHGMFESFVDFVETDVAYNVHGAEAAIKYLHWAIDLKYGDDSHDWIKEGDERYGKPTQQALDAKWILSAYQWWKYQRPYRPDPYATDDINETSELYAKEDEMWMIELIKHRRSLWS